MFLKLDGTDAQGNQTEFLLAIRHIVALQPYGDGGSVIRTILGDDHTVTQSYTSIKEELERIYLD